MKNSLKGFSVLLITSFVFIGIACQPNHQPGEHMDSDEYYMDSIPLIYHMSFMQRYSAKLYLAGMEENWELADIYAHELEELAETIVDGNHMDDDVDVSGLLETMLPPQLEQVGAAIDAGDKEMFERNYETMIQTCNQCHQASNYGLVQVTVPENNPYNQDFSVQKDN
jgi:cytochrome c553